MAAELPNISNSVQAVLAPSFDQPHHLEERRVAQAAEPAFAQLGVQAPHKGTLRVEQVSGENITKIVQIAKEWQDKARDMSKIPENKSKQKLLIDCSSISGGIVKQEKKIKNQALELYVGHSGNVNKPHGMIILERQRKSLHICSLVANPDNLHCPSNERKDREFRRVGPKLITFVEQLAIDKGVNKVALIAIEGAEPFYTAQGYALDSKGEMDEWSKTIVSSTESSAPLQEIG